jgi:hypothetical protein
VAFLLAAAETVQKVALELCTLHLIHPTSLYRRRGWGFNGGRFVVISLRYLSDDGCEVGQK